PPLLPQTMTADADTVRGERRGPFQPANKVLLGGETRGSDRLRARGEVEHLDDSPIPDAHDAVGDVAVRPADADEDTVPRGGYLVDRDAERVPSLSDVLEDGLGLGAVRSGRRAAPPQAAALDPTPVDVRIEQCGQS